MGGSELEAPGTPDGVFFPSQGVWQKLEGQREGEGGGPLLSCQGRPKSKGQQTSRADQQTKQAQQDTGLATSEPDSLPPTWRLQSRGREEGHTHTERALLPQKQPELCPPPAASQSTEPIFSVAPSQSL